MHSNMQSVKRSKNDEKIKSQKKILQKKFENIEPLIA